MPVLVINGARNPGGQTARATAALVAGLKAQGVAAEQVYLPELNLERCRQCNADGWGVCRSEGRCVIEDDFAGLRSRLRAADAVVFATPVYYGDLSESLRAFLDRLRRVGGAAAEHRTGLEGKKAIGICVAGGGGGGSPSCGVALERVLATCRFDVVDIILVRRQNHELKCDVLHATGSWLAKQVSGASTTGA